jgi:acetolactate synthase regulatory subunit
MLTAVEAPALTPTLRLSLQTTGQQDALVRILALLRRRGCTVVSVDFARADRHRPERLQLSLATAPRTGHRVAAWLLALVDVLDVEVE